MDQIAAEAEITRQLRGNERLLWSGKPYAGLLLYPTDIFVIPFSLVIGGFAVYVETSFLRMDVPWFFKLFGVPFVLLVLYVIGGRFVVEAKERGRTAYGVTDERVIIVTGDSGTGVRSLPLAKLEEISLSERSDGSGTIVLGPAIWFFLLAGFRSMPPCGPHPQAPPALESIPEVRVVYNTLLQARSAAR